MISKATNLVFSLALISALTGCEDETIVGNNQGDIIGFVDLLDEKGVKIQNAASVTVTLDDDHSTTTDENGRFEFKDVAAGTYHLTYEKPGFGTMKKYNYIFTAGNVPGVVSKTIMIGLSSVTLTSKVIEISGNTVRVDGTLEETDDYNLLFVFYRTADAKLTEAVMQYGFGWCCAPVSTFSQTMEIPAGTSMYLACYSVSRANESNLYGYYDFETSTYINPALKELFAPIKVR